MILIESLRKMEDLNVEMILKTRLSHGPFSSETVQIVKVSNSHIECIAC